MGISTLQFEHLIDGKKPEARAVSAMFAFHFFAKLRLVSRNACCLYTIMRGSVFVPQEGHTRLLCIVVLNEKLSRCMTRVCVR